MTTHSITSSINCDRILSPNRECSLAIAGLRLWLAAFRSSYRLNKTNQNNIFSSEYTNLIDY
jgi:hypothetical protein